ncbi:MAG: hypothetical protein IIY21_04360 [Clostridiales bacterium]|nr:hypothetical protein [Clostridiales bacterium]MBQ1573881.1 hypothetical protein [Clostridiales bacterium]
MNHKGLIDFTQKGCSPIELEKEFRTGGGELVVRTEIKRDIEITAKPFVENNISARDFNVVTTEGKMTIDKYNMVRYLRAKRVVYDGANPLIFNGYVYTKIDNDTVARMIYKGVEEYPNPPMPSKTAVADVIAMLKVTNTSLDIDAPIGWDETGLYDENVVPFMNGLYNIEHDELLPFTPNIFINYMLMGTYNPSITEHPVEKEYKKILPDKGTRDFFFEMVGYSIFSRQMSPPAIFIIYGPGNTGKSALQVAVTALAGFDNVSTLDLSQLSGTFTTAELYGKLINICGETGSGQNRNVSKVDGELLKRLSDGQPISVQHKYGHPFQMLNRAKLWFVTNTLPDLGDTSSGLYRRVYIIPCRVEQNWDDQMYDKMTEPDAVCWLANKALEGYRRFLANGSKFHVSAEMLTELKAYRRQDGFMDFMMSKFGTTDKVALSNKLDGMMLCDIYDDYKEYCATNGAGEMGSKKIAEKIRNEFAIKTENVRTIQPNGRPTYKVKFVKYQAL